MENTVEGGYGWVIVGVGFFYAFVANGISLTFGLMVPTVVDNFHCSTSQAVLIGSLNFGLTYMTALIACCLTEIVGFRKVAFLGAILGAVACIISGFMTDILGLTMTFGVLLGFALGMVNTPAQLLVNHYFHKKRALAYGLSVSGSPLGTFVLSLSIGQALQTVPIEAIYLIMAGLVGFCGLLALLLKSPTTHHLTSQLPMSSLQSYSRHTSYLLLSDNQENQMVTERDEPENCSSQIRLFFNILFDRHVTRNCGFWLYLSGKSFLAFSLNVPHFVLPILMEGSVSSYAVAIVGLSTGLGRILSGVINFYPQSHLLVQSFMCIMAGISTMAFSHCETKATIYILAAVYGLASGPLIALEAVSCVACVGQNHVGTALGWLDLSEGLFTLIGPTIIGHLYDIYQEMFVPLYVAGGCYFGAAAIFLGTHFYLKT